MSDIALALCYLCARAPVPAVVEWPAVVAWKPMPGLTPTLRLPGICETCKRVHLTSEPNK